MSTAGGSEHPAWLKANQNGSIGEARSKAFLLDRFWVLERSVDIDGADFIIQRRITSRNLFDRNPPRLGVIQVKFFGTEKTTHYVHKEYVVTHDGAVRSEFFLLCHSGGEEDPRLYLLSGKDLYESFLTVSKKGSDRYRVSFSDVCEVDKYTVLNRKLALDRIENAMSLADFANNRRFMSWVLPYPSGELDAILPEYKEPIENDWGDLPQAFIELKEAVRSDLFRIEEVYEILAKIMEEADPMVVSDLVEKAAYFCRSGDGRGWGISLEGDYDNEDFFNASRRHILVVKGLKELGLLDKFIDLRTEIKTRVVAFLHDKLPLDADKLHVFSVEFDIDQFSIARFDSKILRKEVVVKMLEEEGEELKEGWRGGLEIPELREVVPGILKGIWSPPGYHWGTAKDEDQTNDHFKAHDFPIYRECVSYLLHKKFPEEFEWPPW